jgi:energy-coupling factor transport system substrate-specific component
MMDTNAAPAAPRAAGLAHGPWRTVDLMTTALVGVTFGVVYWGWSAAYTALNTPLTNALGPAISLVGGMWLIAGVVGALLVRRPGAALFAEMLAAAVSALIGNEWGWSVLISGVLQGLGVEIVFAIFLFRQFGWYVAAAGGALGALLEFGYEWNAYWQGTSASFKLWYAVCFMASAAVIAGIGGWLLTRALAATGAVDALPAGREAAERNRH